MGAVFGDGLPGASGEVQSNGLLQLGHIDALFLEIGILPHHPGRVKLQCTSAVGVASTDPRALICDWTDSAHRLLVTVLGKQYPNIFAIIRL